MKGEDGVVMMSRVHVGASGWARPEWCDIVYGRAGSRGWHPLDIITRLSGCAEIDHTFHAPLRPEVAHVYARKAARRPDFLFTALAGRCFTYDRSLDESMIAQWREGFMPLLRAGRLAALIFQFPAAFRFTQENREFLVALRGGFHDFPVAAELRHDSWLCDEAWTTLVHHHIGFVNIDQPASLRATPPGALLTTSAAVVRLHGRSNSQSFQDFHAGPGLAYLYDLDEILEWKPRIERLASFAGRTLVCFTNCPAARSMVNALQMREVLGQGPLEAPAPLIARYPAELAAFRAKCPVQTNLGPAQAA